MALFTKQVNTLFRTIKPILWLIFAIMMSLIFLYLYHNETGFNPVDFAVKHSTIVKEHEVKQSCNSEGKLIAVCGTLYTPSPVTETGLLPGQNFVTLERAQQHYTRRRKRSPYWRTTEQTSQTCDLAYIGQYKLCPAYIIPFETKPFSSCIYASKKDRLSFSGIPSSTQGVFLAQVSEGWLIPYRVKQAPYGSWIGNLLYNADDKEYVFFHFSKGSFDDLLKALEQLHSQELYSVRLQAWCCLCIVLAIPFTIIFRKMRPSPEYATKLQQRQRAVGWFLCLIVVATACFFLFISIIKQLP